MELVIQIRVEELPEGVFLATSDELHGLVSQGPSRKRWKLPTMSPVNSSKPGASTKGIALINQWIAENTRVAALVPPPPGPWSTTVRIGASLVAPSDTYSPSFIDTPVTLLSDPPVISILDVKVPVGVTPL